MKDRHFKHLTNHILNQLAAEHLDTSDQVEAIRELIRLLTVEAAALEVLAATKEQAA